MSTPHPIDVASRAPTPVQRRPAGRPGESRRWPASPHTGGAAALVLVVAALASACAGDGAATDPAPPTDSAWAQVQAEILDRRCATGGCHASASQAGGLSLAADDSWVSLVNVEPQNAVARAAGLMRVVPNSPEESYFLKKLTGDLDSGEGSPMPIGTAGLLQVAPEEYEMIRQWILAGAPGPDEPEAGAATSPDHE